MSNKRINKAYVRYDGTGRVVPGSLILNRFKPAVGKWHEIDAYECCNPAHLPTALRFSSIIAPGGEQGCFYLQAINDGGADVNGVIDWGDGTIDNIIVPADGNNYNFTHSYLQGSYTATVTFDTPERIIGLYITCND